MEEELVMSAIDCDKTIESLADETVHLSKDLGRPLRYIQINSFYGGSTGTIMRGLHFLLDSQGIDSYCFWGRRHETIDDHMVCCASRSEVCVHGAMTRLYDRMGFYSKRDTKKLLSRLDEIDPDIVHLHNIHGYYVNIEMLFRWLASHRCQVRWTLHDCWALTGHCAYFTYVQCAQWQSHCALLKPCPQLDSYPKTICKSNCSKNYEAKRRIFTMIPLERMTLISPSQWLADLVGQSFLKDYPIKICRNTIDRTVFKPTSSVFRESYRIDNRFMVLGVASPWTERKGLGDFVRLAREFDSEKVAVVLVGLSDKQIEQFQNQLPTPPKTELRKSLAEACSSTDAFVDPCARETFGMAAAVKQACDAPAVVIEGSACPEDGDSTKGIVSSTDLSALKGTVLDLAMGGRAVLFARTDSAVQLAAIYTAADVFFNPTVEDNYPTVNLEAEACGTPVITYDTGGCVETLADCRSLGVDGFNGAVAALIRIMERKGIAC